MLDVGYGNWQVDKCSTNVWIGDPLFMSTPLLNMDTICQRVICCPSTQSHRMSRPSSSMDILSERGRFSPLNLTYLTYWILLYPQAIRGINTKLFLFSGKYWADFWHRDYIETLFSIHEFCRITRTTDCQEIERGRERVLFCLKSGPLFTTPNITFCQPNGPINLRSVTSTYR